MKQQLIGVVAACLFGMALPAAAQSPEERAAARQLLSDQGDAVVTVLGSGRVRMSRGGVETVNRDERISATATVLDASGLAVMSLGALDPADLMAAALTQANTRGAPPVSVTTEATELRYRLEDGSEVPARVVLRDRDLDLAFLRPADPVAEPMAHVEGTADRLEAVDLLVVLQRLPDTADWQAAAMFANVMAVIDRPRLIYLVNSSAFGAPAFDTRGQFVGVVVRRRGTVGSPTSAPPIVLPAGDILEVAKQAQ